MSLVAFNVLLHTLTEPNTLLLGPRVRFGALGRMVRPQVSRRHGQQWQDALLAAFLPTLDLPGWYFLALAVPSTSPIVLGRAVDPTVACNGSS